MPLPRGSMRHIRAAERTNNAERLMAYGRCCAFVPFYCGLHLFQRFNTPRRQALWEWCCRQNWTVGQLDLTWRLLCVGNSPLVIEPVVEAGCGDLVARMAEAGLLPKDVLVSPAANFGAMEGRSSAL